MRDLFKVLAKPKKFEKVKRDQALYNAGVLLLDKKIKYEEWRDILSTLMTYDSETSKGLPFEFGKGQAPPKFKNNLSKLVRQFLNALEIDDAAGEWRKIYKRWTDFLPAETTIKLKYNIPPHERKKK